MSINFQLLDIRAFLALAKLESFHETATHLNFSQPALSRRIQKLEEALGSPLFERSTRKVSLTNVGRRLLPIMENLLAEFDTALQQVTESGSEKRGTVTIACVPTAAFYFMPRVISEFHALHPNIRIRILDLSAIEGLASVANGEAEFGINMLGSSDPEVKFTPLLEDHFVLACNRNHPLAQVDKVQWTDLEGYPLIGVSRHSGNRMIIDGALASLDLELDWFYEVHHLSTSLGLVEAGVAMSILPRLAAPNFDHPLVVTKPLGNPTITRAIGIVERRNGHLSPSAQRLRDMLLASWGENRPTQG